MKNTKEYLDYIILVVCSLTLLSTCTKSNTKKFNALDKKIVSLETKIDSLGNLIIKKDEMIKLIKETPAWKTLRIEEISDKERISINALEEKNK